MCGACRIGPTCRNVAGAPVRQHTRYRRPGGLFKRGHQLEHLQSNHEGALIDRLHERDFDAAIVNAGGLTHTSVALRDALLGVARPFIEVHLSDPSKREAFRQVNFLRDIAVESIVGQGARGYALALESLARSPGPGVAKDG